MQTLFNKKKKIEKQNNYLVNTFFINILIITILSMNIIKFLSIEFILGLISLFTISEFGIVLKVKKNEEIIKKINIELKRILQNNKKVIIKKYDYLSNKSNIKNNEVITSKKIKVKKKTLKKVR